MSGPRQSLAERNHQIVAMYEAGMNAREVGREFMLSEKMVLCILRMLGAQMRSKGNSVRWIGAS